MEDFSLKDEVSIEKLCVLFLQVMTGHEVLEGTLRLGDTAATEVGLCHVAP